MQCRRYNNARNSDSSPNLLFPFIGLLRQRSDEILNVKAELKSKEETLQQKEIDLSVLRGQVRQALGDLNSVDDDSDTLTFMGSEAEVEDDIFVDEIDLLEDERA